MLRSFIRWNRRVSERICLLFPHARLNLEIYFDQAVVKAASGVRQTSTILDVGGGRRCTFSKQFPVRSAVHITTLDASQTEMDLNKDVDRTVQGDASGGLPFPDASFDVVSARYAIEHFPDQSVFLRESFRFLRPGGHLCILSPNRYAPYALINRVVQPDKPLDQEVAFEAFYDQCSPRQLRRAMEKAGFTVATLRVGYFQSFYFAFFLPLCMMFLALEIVVAALGLQDLSAGMLVVARKGPERISQPLPDLALSA